MRTIETTVVVTREGLASLTLPPDVPPGEHHVVLVMDYQPADQQPTKDLILPVLNPGPWPEDLSLRREDMYDNDGR